MINASQIATRLTSLKPSEVQAIRLAREIEQGEFGGLPATALLEISPRIEAALAEAERIAEESRRIVRQCLELKSIPHNQVPLGF